MRWRELDWPRGSRRGKGRERTVKGREEQWSTHTRSRGTAVDGDEPMTTASSPDISVGDGEQDRILAGAKAAIARPARPTKNISLRTLKNRINKVNNIFHN